MKKKIEDICRWLLIFIGLWVIIFVANAITNILGIWHLLEGSITAGIIFGLFPKFARYWFGE